MFGSASGRAGNGLELNAFMRDKENTRAAARSTGDYWRMIFSENRFPLFGIMRWPGVSPLITGSAAYWMGGLGSRLLPGSITKV
jgi:hypothetical protein